MSIAHARDAARSSEFYFRKQILEAPVDDNAASKSTGLNTGYQGDINEEYELMTMNEIFNGKVNGVLC